MLKCSNGLLDKFIKENKCQEEERVAEAVEAFCKLKLICNRFAHPEGSENVVAWRHRLVPLCLQIVNVMMNNLYPARRLDDSAGKFTMKVEIGRSPVSTTATDRTEKEAFYRSVHERNRDIVNNFLEAIPTKEAILRLSLNELARLLESQVMAPTIIRDGDGASFELRFNNVSKGVCEYVSSPKGWMCCAQNASEDPWKDEQWSCKTFAE